MDWPVLKPSLISLFSSLAAEDMRAPLPEGVVNWFGAQTPFISNDTAAGLYLRVVSYTKLGRSRKRNTLSTVNGRQVLIPERTSRGKVTLQVQAKCLENSDTNDGQIWIDRIIANLDDEAVIAYLRRLGWALVRVLPTFGVTVKSVLDGTLGWDNREISAVSADLIFNVTSKTLGLPIEFVERVRYSGEITGAVGGTIQAPEVTIDGTR